MSFYGSIWPLNKQEPRRIAAGLFALRRQLSSAEGILPKTIESNLLLATCNIREFGGTKYGRCPDCYYFIAETIHHFDLIAIQQVREDLGALKKILVRSKTGR
jgi:hypothetical protein